MTTLADVIALHGVSGDPKTHETVCYCGWTSGRMRLGQPLLAHRDGAEHLAQVIRDHLTALAGDAGVREVAGGRLLEHHREENPGVEYVGPEEPEGFVCCADAAVAAFLGCVG